MAPLPGLNKGVFKDPDPPLVDSVLSPIVIPNGTTLVTTKPYNEIIDNVDELIDYVSGDNGPNFIPQLAIDSLVSDLAARELTANKGAISGYAGLDASQELLLANFPSGVALQVLRRNAGNTALEFATISDLQGITSINGDTTAAQILMRTTGRISIINGVGGVHTFDIDPTYVGQASITTLGTITTGVWNGTAITGAFINAALTDLSDVTAKTGTGTIVVMDTSPTIVTPTIASFVNANHNHQAAAGGGQLDSTLALSDTDDIAYLNTPNTYIAGNKQSFVADATTAAINLNAQIPSTPAPGDIFRSAEVLHFIGTTTTEYLLVSDGQPTTYTAGLQDFSAVTLRIPVSATPSVTVDGDIAFDSLVTDFSTGLIRFFGAEEQGIVTMPIAQFTTPSDGFVIAYNATNDEFELVAAGAGGEVFTWTANHSMDTFRLLAAGGTQGDILKHDATGFFRFPLGTNPGQFLRVNAAGTDLQYTDDVFTINFVIDGGGSTITTGVKGTITVDFNCEVLEWAVTADQSGDIVVDVNRATFAGYPTTASIAGTELPTIVASTKGEDRTITTWSTIATGDVLEFEVDSITTLQRVTVSIVCRKTG